MLKTARWMAAVLVSCGIMVGLLVTQTHDEPAAGADPTTSAAQIAAPNQAPPFRDIEDVSIDDILAGVVVVSGR